MNKTFSDSDISRYIPNVVLYNELANVNAVELLKCLPLAILYQVEENYGHWVLLHAVPEGLEFFDPYGYMPDREFEVLEWKQPHYVARLLRELSAIVPIHYNQYDFQEKGMGVNTCGRWIVLRSLFDNMPLEIFARMIVKACNMLEVTPDELAVLAFKE